MSVLQNLFMGLLLFSTCIAHGNLEITFENCPQNPKGNIMINLFNSEDNWDKDIETRNFKIKSERCEEKIIIDDLSPGEYAITVVYDENLNGIHDKNLFGFPVELFAISNIQRKLFKKPNWDEVRFEFNKNMNLKLFLKYL